jgi:hypothetical protein
LEVRNLLRVQGACVQPRICLKAAMQRWAVSSSEKRLPSCSIR